MKTAGLVISLMWIAAVGYLAGLRWPRVPLDMSPNDPATLDALNAAVLQHVLLYGALALIPPLVLLIAQRFAGRS